MKPCIFVEKKRNEQGKLPKGWLAKHVETCSYCQEIMKAILKTIAEKEGKL